MSSAFYELRKYRLGPEECKGLMARIDAEMVDGTRNGISDKDSELSRRIRQAILEDEDACAWLMAVGGGGGGVLDVSVSDEWLFVRYDTGGDNISPHFDGTRRLMGGTRSSASLLIYLNDEDFTGGRTVFMDPASADQSQYDQLVAFTRTPPDPDPSHVVVPRRGKVVLLRQDVLHYGEAIEGRSRKYLVRADVGLPSD